MSVLEQFGVDAAKVASTAGPKYPKEVPNRVAHIDADFMAYQVSAESKEELDPYDPTPRKTLDDMRHNAFEAVDHIRRLAGAERAVLHTTHNSDKGGRNEQAILKPYQANRNDRERPEHLKTLKLFLASGVGDTSGVFTGINHTDQEADDGMTQAHYADPENTVVCSMDKDLLMVPGLKLNMYTDEIRKVPGQFGSIWKQSRTGSTGKVTTKITGEGTKFFWLQLLMGDTADNIGGLPMCPGKIWQDCAGTKDYQDTYRQWTQTNDVRTAEKLADKLEKLTAKPKQCGQMLAYSILKDVRNDKDCFQIVKECYVELEREHGHEYRHWKTGERVTATQALLSEMKLLWMRRYKDPDDVLHWIKGFMQ